MEDFVIDIMIGKGATARSIRLDLPQFTLIGATTRAGMLSAPLRDRFGVIQRLEFYSAEELSQIIGLSRKSIIQNMKKLQDSGLLKRVGADKNGYWEIEE